MKLIDVASPTRAISPITNILIVDCGCGVRFAWPSHISLATCPGCGRQELWHDVAPVPEQGRIWAEPVMEDARRS